jgi:hypothetical protein
MKTNTTGAKINVLTSIVVKTLVKTPLAVTVVFSSRDNLVDTVMVTQEQNHEEVSLALQESFNLDSDYLVAVTRSGECGTNCQYTLLAGKAPDWFEHPEREAFNMLGDSGTMECGNRWIVALPLSFIADRVGNEKPRV